MTALTFVADLRTGLAGSAVPVMHICGRLIPAPCVRVLRNPAISSFRALIASEPATSPSLNAASRPTKKDGKLAIV